MKSTLATVAVLTLALSACANATAPDAIGPKLEVAPFSLEALPLGEVRGGSNMAKHAPETLLRALLLPLNKKPTCTADTNVNPRWVHCGNYELAECTGGAFGFTCDIIVGDLAIGSLTSRVSGDTWSFTAHWDEQFVQGVRDFDGAVVVVSK